MVIFNAEIKEKDLRVNTTTTVDAWGAPKNFEIGIFKGKKDQVTITLWPIRCDPEARYAERMHALAVLCVESRSLADAESKLIDLTDRINEQLTAIEDFHTSILNSPVQKLLSIRQGIDRCRFEIERLLTHV